MWFSIIINLKSNSYAIPMKGNKLERLISVCSYCFSDERKLLLVVDELVALVA